VQNNTGSIRRLMNLMESIHEPVLIEGWVQNLKNKRLKRLGDQERAQMADRLNKEWLKWLGQTDRQGTMEDMERFMISRIGFTEDDIASVIDPMISDEDQSNEPEASAPEGKTTNQTQADFKGSDITVEPNDNKTDPNEVIDSPRKYLLSNGDWDRKKISAKLARMGVGDKLTLGSSTFTRTLGAKATSESINEANDSKILDRATVAAIMDRSAAYINDAYILNGPQNDQDDIAADALANNLGGRRSASNTPSGSLGKSTSGQYNAAEMYNILKTDFQKNDGWVKSVTRKVMQADSISKMTDADMHDLALLGWALTRARN
jgi:hypothetical protein